MGRRIGDCSVLNAEVADRQPDASGARIKWKFTTKKARQKLARTSRDTAKDLDHCDEVLEPADY